jgi:hypothetical protein
MSKKDEDMFRLVAEITNGRDPEKHIDVCMKTEKFYEFLGRYLYKYGPPVVVEVSHGTSEYEYSREINGVQVSAIVSFAKVAEKQKDKGKGSSAFQRSQVPTVTHRHQSNWQPKPEPPKPEFLPNTPTLDAMVKAGFLEEATLKYSHVSERWNFE